MTMESDIHEWIVDQLSVVLKEFNNMPACPYAKQAMLDGKIRCVEINNTNNVTDDLLYELKNYSDNWPENTEVVVLACNPNLISAEQLSEIAEQANNTFLKTNGYLVLEDHPDSKESVAGYVLNQGTWAILLLQSHKKIIDAREILKKRGYYKNWDSEYYKEVVLDRS